MFGSNYLPDTKRFAGTRASTQGDESPKNTSPTRALVAMEMTGAKTSGLEEETSPGAVLVNVRSPQLGEVRPPPSPTGIAVVSIVASHGIVRVASILAYPFPRSE